MKTIQNELGTQVLTDFEEALSVRGVKVCLCDSIFNAIADVILYFYQGVTATSQKYSVVPAISLRRRQRGVSGFKLSMMYLFLASCWTELSLVRSLSGCVRVRQ